MSWPFLCISLCLSHAHTSCHISKKRTLRTKRQLFAMYMCRIAHLSANKSTAMASRPLATVKQLFMLHASRSVCPVPTVVAGRMSDISFCCTHRKDGLLHSAGYHGSKRCISQLPKLTDHHRPFKTVCPMASGALNRWKVHRHCQAHRFTKDNAAGLHILEPVSYHMQKAL